MQAQNLTHTQNESIVLLVWQCWCTCMHVWESFLLITFQQNLSKISEPFLGKKEAKQIFQIDILPNWEKVRRKSNPKMHLCNDEFSSKTFDHVFQRQILLWSFLLSNYVIAQKVNDFVSSYYNSVQAVFPPEWAIKLISIN